MKFNLKGQSDVLNTLVKKFIKKFQAEGIQRAAVWGSILKFAGSGSTLKFDINSTNHSV
jgi:hypothetical protein